MKLLDVVGLTLRREKVERVLSRTEDLGETI